MKMSMHTLGVDEAEARHHAMNAGKTVVAASTRPLPREAMEAMERGVALIIVEVINDQKVAKGISQWNSL